MHEWTLYLAIRKKQLFYIGLFSVFINLCMLVLPIYSLQIFSRVLTSHSVESLVFLALIALFLLLFQALLEFIRQRLLQTSSAKFDLLCSEHVVDFSLSTAALDPKRARETLQDLVQARSAISSPAISLLFDLPWTPLFILVIFSLHPLLGWFAFSATLVLTLLTCANLWLTQKNQDKLIKENLNNDSHLQRLLEHGQSIALFDAAKPLAKRWYQHNMDMVEAQQQTSLQLHLLQALIKYARMALQVGVIGLGAWLVIMNETDAGVMLAASILLSRVLAPLDQGINLWRPWRYSRAALQRIRMILEDDSNETRIEMPIDNVTLSVTKLSLKDSSNKMILNNIQFELKPNNALAIVGASGSGKSSLLNLLAGHNELQQGEVRVNGINISELLPQQRNQLIGYLPQQVDLFDTSVLDNISCFTQDDDVEGKVFNAAKLVGIHEFISQLPQAYNTVIGHGGVQLSGGEMQLIALARALYHQPKLLLLDEPDSNLDIASEQMLLSTVNKLKAHGVSIIFVTHREQLLQAVDWVIVLDKGVIKDAGKKEPVLERLQSKQVKSSLQSKLHE